MFSIDGITLFIAPIAAVLSIMYAVRKGGGKDEN